MAVRATASHVGDWIKERWMDGSTDLQAVREQLGHKCEEDYWLKHIAVAEFDVDHKGEYGRHGGKTHYKPGEVEESPQPTTPMCEK